MSRQLDIKSLRFWRQIGVSRKTALLMAVALISLCVGFIIGRATAPAKSSLASSVSTTRQTQDNKSRATKGYERALKMVEQDLQAERLTKDEAAKLRSKLDEAYAYRKTITSTEADRKELRTKLTEWQKWARQNDLSPRYFMPLY